MTRKDYELIANVIRETKFDASVENPVDNYEKGFVAGIQTLEDALNVEFQKTNPRFDVVRFQKACNPWN